ncbi:MAG TPA: citrate transporter, partial [Gammaproteobacteria bacterium]
AHTHIDWVRLGIVVLILLTAMGVNITINLKLPELADRFPFLGVAVWLAILISMPLRRPDWEEVSGSVKGTIFLLSLVLSASMMPVEKLPLASWETSLGLGFVSAVFDNIPLTALALQQGGYDWGMLAYAVGFGGSMLWFGSSAGVALTNMYPEGKSVWLWLREGWYVAVGYVAGFLVMLWLVGWHPHAPHKVQLPTTAATEVSTPAAH